MTTPSYRSTRATTRGAFAALSLAVAFLSVGCPAPNEPICSLRCSPHRECPSDYECRSDQYCHLKGSTAACPFALPDMAVGPVPTGDMSATQMSSVDMSSVDGGLMAMPPDMTKLAAAGATCMANSQCASNVCGTSGTGHCCAAACNKSDATCGASGCDGSGACIYPTSATSCGTAGCSNGQLTSAGSCSGTGTCTTVSAPCPGNFICASATSCKTACTQDSDCEAGGTTKCINPGAQGTCTCGQSFQKCAFTTSTTTNGKLGGLTGADAFCQARATAALLGGTFKAWLSDATGSPSTRFTQATVPYVRLDGAKVANNWAGLTSGTLIKAINVDENGRLNLPSTNQAWTNTAANGTRQTATPGTDCMSWASGDFMSPGWRGQIDQTDSTWTDQNLSTCDFQNVLYCFEQ